jgi:hypothetical protein
VCGVVRILSAQTGEPPAGHGEAYILGLAEGIVCRQESIGRDAENYCLRHRLFWEATGLVVEGAIASAAAEAFAGGAKPS